MVDIGGRCPAVDAHAAVAGEHELPGRSASVYRAADAAVRHKGNNARPRVRVRAAAA